MSGEVKMSCILCVSEVISIGNILLQMIYKSENGCGGGNIDLIPWKSFWHLYYLTFLFITNLTETRLLGFNIFYLLWVTTVFGLTSDLKENRVLWNSADCEIPKK